MSKKTSKDMDADVIIIGGGPAGLSLAALLGANDVRVICLDRDPPAAQTDPRFDGRTTAISYGSRLVLEHAGAWETMEKGACPIDTIKILDGKSPVLLEFDCHEVGNRSFGWIVENLTLRRALFDRLADLPTVTHIAPAKVTDFTPEEDRITVHLEDGTGYCAPLAIGADGRQSFTREWMGIGTRNWPYNHIALVCNVLHENPHHNVAVEHFLPQGPFAILPLADTADGQHRSGIVWTEHSRRKHYAMDYSEESFNAALAARFPAEYGAVKLAGKRMAYPLGLIHAYNYIGPRTALVADAAHGIHPIAGQGLNLGYRDIAAIAELVIDAKKQGHDIGDEGLLNRYQRIRRFDNVAMAGTTDLLTRLFSNNILPLKIARKAGLKAVSRLPFAKQFFMKQAMGVSGLLPELMRDHEEHYDQAA